MPSETCQVELRLPNGFTNENRRDLEKNSARRLGEVWQQRSGWKRITLDSLQFRGAHSCSHVRCWAECYMKDMNIGSKSICDLPETHPVLQRSAILDWLADNAQQPSIKDKSMFVDDLQDFPHSSRGKKRKLPEKPKQPPDELDNPPQPGPSSPKLKPNLKADPKLRSDEMIGSELFLPERYLFYMLRPVRPCLPCNRHATQA